MKQDDKGSNYQRQNVTKILEIRALALCPSVSLNAQNVSFLYCTSPSTGFFSFFRILTFFSLNRLFIFHLSVSNPEVQEGNVTERTYVLLLSSHEQPRLMDQIP